MTQTPDSIRAKVNWKLKTYSTGYRTDHVAVIWLLSYTPKVLPNGEYTGMIMDHSLKRNVVVFSMDPDDIDFYNDYTIIWINPELLVKTDGVKLNVGRKASNKARLTDVLDDFERVIGLPDLSDNKRAKMLNVSETKFKSWCTQYNELFPEKLLDRELH
jgi:hypothetical protein